LLEEGGDVCRSLADRAGTLLLLDVDCSNHDDPAEPYRDPARTFELLEPVHRATLAAFERHGLRPLVLMTGRGYHYALRAVAGTPLHTALVGLGPLGPSLRARYGRLAAETGTPVAMGHAHEGAGRLLEYLAHEVALALAGRTEVPLVLADVRPEGGGPFICLDLTAYADPLFARHVRCAFTSNQKPRVQGLQTPRGFVLTLPRRDQPLAELLRAREDPEAAQAMAADADTRIPTALGGAEWVACYRGSALARFHRAFDAGPEMEPAAWPFSYDSLDLGTVPGCAAFPLRRPNPALLAPGWLRSVALGLWVRGWHPRSVAGLVSSRYAGPHGWGGYWERYDRECRARFHVRLCCGALAAGVEDRTGFTCVSQRARGLCPAAGCGFELRRPGNGPVGPEGGTP
jgi:hypothetical protein